MREHASLMFRITTEKRRGKVILTVEGRLAGQGVSTFEQCWRELRGDSPQEKFSIDLCGVTFIDAAGRALLKEIHRRSEEHTSELQSPCNLVCRLLLEKKKKRYNHLYSLPNTYMMYMRKKISTNLSYYTFSSESVLQ